MKSSLIKLSRKTHQWLIWISLIAVCAFVLSAFTHPIMVWTGPQAETFRPPTMMLQGKSVLAIPDILKTNQIKEAIVTKVVPTADGEVLQVTEHEKMPRRYFSLTSGEELKHYDEKQAIWLARYYTKQQAKIKSIEYITEFSHEYPWVNRLIPVYRVNFESEQHLTAYVYTETNTLAGLNNDWKRGLQVIFQTFHTWSWLDDLPLLRVFIVSTLLLTLLSMLVTGLIMLLGIKRKKYQSSSQSIHRKLAWIVLLPLFGFTLSGVYHFYQYEYGDNLRGMRLGSTINFSELPKINPLKLTQLSDKRLNSFSLIQHDDALYYRASIAHKKTTQAHKPHAHHDTKTRNKRFDGISQEKTALYIPLHKNRLHTEGKANESLDERLVAKKLALNYLSLPSNHPADIELVTRFGAEYDFRNKRLPVWKITTKTEQGDRLFVDPATGILVDHLVDTQRYEGYSFSLLHKWNFLLAFAERKTRDIIILLFLFLIGTLGFLGFLLRKAKRSHI